MTQSTAILKDEKAVAALEALVAQPPPYMRDSYEKADKEIRRLYGDSPGVTGLMLFWMASPLASHVRVEFERAILDITRTDPLTPNEEDYFDEDSLA